METLDLVIKWTLWGLLVVTVITSPFIIIDLLGRSGKIFSRIPRGFIQGFQDPGGRFVKWAGNIPNHVVDMNTGHIIQKSDPIANDVKVASRIPIFGYVFVGWNPLRSVFDARIKYKTTESSGTESSLKIVDGEIRTDLPFQENLAIVTEGIQIDASSVEGLQSLLLDTTCTVGIRAVESDSMYGILPNDTSPWPNVVQEALEAALRSAFGDTTYEEVVKGKGREAIAENVRKSCQNIIDTTYSTAQKNVAVTDKHALVILTLRIASIKVSDRNPKEVLDAFASQNTVDIRAAVRVKEAEANLKVAEMEAKGNAAQIDKVVEAFNGDRAAALAFLKATAMADAIREAKPLVVTTGGELTPPIILDSNRTVRDDTKDKK